MGRIRVLSDQVANKIAAGEVVERPASVIKELLENSLDAGATHLKIEVESGGRRLIRVSDDGSGMLRDDALLAFERHATSKLSGVKDLDSISTLGFRGEALPSIASVARLVLENARNIDANDAATQRDNNIRLFCLCRGDCAGRVLDCGIAFDAKAGDELHASLVATIFNLLINADLFDECFIIG